MFENAEGSQFCRIFVPRQEVYRRRAAARQGESDAAGGEKAVKDAFQSASRHALTALN
ncbi:hypothetical protein [Paenibacillus amylolyticus]|uniref:hypothetical protein n=1 Tax=Paenibacillus amylolyticus TaxID=1451 RepID=UPI001374F168|nr:hypothetical protein [Paenibacillus amylolyticus]